MQEPTAWVVSTLRRGHGEHQYLQVLVLCPLCQLVHTHGANTPDNPGLGGRVGHCGKSRPAEGPSGYDLAWPDDAGAQLLASQMRQCHAIVNSTGKPCASTVPTGRIKGFYCGRHDEDIPGRSAVTRIPIDTSAITVATQESIHTPKYELTSLMTEPYRQLSPDEVSQWEIERRGKLAAS